MSFLCTNLVQAILSELGQVDPVIGLFDATGGTATTFVAGTASTGFGLLDNPPDTDFFKNYLAIVVRDSAGASASPEGKWGIVSGYVDTTWTGTIPTVTDAIASGDTIMLAKQDKFPISQIMFAINRAVESLGDLPSNADATLTTAASQTEYDIPVAVKRGLKQVWIQGVTSDSNNNQWVRVYDTRNELTSAGTASILYIPQYPSGRTIRLIYDGPHPVISAYSGTINEYVHPRVAICASIIKLLEWYNRQDSNQDANSYLLWLEKQYREQYLPVALAENPIQRAKPSDQYMTFSGPSRDLPPSPFVT